MPRQYVDPAEYQAKIAGLEIENARLRKELEARGPAAPSPLPPPDVAELQAEIARVTAERDALLAKPENMPLSEEKQKELDIISETPDSSLSPTTETPTQQ